VERALGRGKRNVVHREDNLFAGGKFAAVLSEAGVKPRLTCSPDLRACVYRRRDGADEEYFVFFFNLDAGGGRDQFIEFHGRRLALRLGSRTCGALRIRGGRLASYLVKGDNEVEGYKADVRIQLGPLFVEGSGDFSSTQEDPS
jgi:hypothetical protein